jgi:hypothetical protein
MLGQGHLQVTGLPILYVTCWGDLVPYIHRAPHAWPGTTGDRASYFIPTWQGEGIWFPIFIVHLMLRQGHLHQGTGLPNFILHRERDQGFLYFYLIWRNFSRALLDIRTIFFAFVSGYSDISEPDFFGSSSEAKLDRIRIRA